MTSALMEQSLEALAHSSMQVQLREAANGLTRAGIREYAVPGDPESPGHMLAVALNRTGVIMDLVEQADDRSIVNAVAHGRPTMAGIVPLQRVGEDKSIPLNPTNENVLEVLRRSVREFKTITFPYSKDASQIVMGIILAPRKI